MNNETLRHVQGQLASASYRTMPELMSRQAKYVDTISGVMNTRYGHILQELASLDAKVTSNVGRVELKVDELGEQVRSMNTNLQSMIDLLQSQAALSGQATDPKDGESTLELSSLHKAEKPEVDAPSPAPAAEDDNSDSNGSKAESSVGLDEQHTPPWNHEDAVATAPAFTPHKEHKDNRAVPDGASIV